MSTQASGRETFASIARALEATGDAPSVFGSFVRTIASLSTAPDFTEHSATFGAAASRFRLTAYFDDAFAHGAVDASLIRAFGSLLEESGFGGRLELEAALDALAPEAASVEQLVLGVDARASRAESRLKLYVVFSRSPGDAFDRVRASLGLAPMPALDPREVRLLGLDVSETGVSDLKAYLRLDPARLGRVVRDLGALGTVATSAREVVLQQGLTKRDRRQLHFHATDEAVYSTWLRDRARTDAGASLLVDHADSLNRELSTIRLAPWIIGLPYRDGDVTTDAGNVYFHPMPR